MGKFESAWYRGAAQFLPIVIWAGSIASIPAGWHLCNGEYGTPDLRDRFIRGPDSGVNTTGGSASYDLSHTHGWELGTPYRAGSIGSATTENQIGGLRHTHAGEEAKYITLPIGFPYEAAATANPATHGVTHQHLVDVTPQPATTEHNHLVIGVSGSALGVETILPKYYAKAYIMPESPVDIPLGSMVWSSSDYRLLPANYVRSGYDDYDATPYIGGAFLVGAGSDIMFGEFLYGEYLAYHSHDLPNTDTDGIHQHPMSNNGTLPHSEVMESDGAGWGLGGWLMWNFNGSPGHGWNQGAYPNYDMTPEVDGAHSHITSTGDLRWSKTINPPWYSLYHIVRPTGAAGDTLPIGSIVAFPPQWLIEEMPPEWGPSPGEQWVAEWHSATNIAPGDTVITLDDSWGMFTPPALPFVISTGGPYGFEPYYDEKMLVTSFNSPTSWNVTRGYGGTTIQNFTYEPTFYADMTLDRIPAGWEIRTEFENCYIPCAGGSYAVDETGGDNHWQLPSTHIHSNGTIHALASVERNSHLHPILCSLQSETTGSAAGLDDPTGMYHVVPANRDHQHQRTTNSVGWTYGNQSSPAVQAMAHEHEMSGALQPSYDAWNPAYGADNSMCNYNYGIYFIQKVA